MTLRPSPPLGGEGLFAETAPRAASPCAQAAPTLRRGFSRHRNLDKAAPYPHAAGAMWLKQGIVRLLKLTGLHTLQANLRFLARHDITYLPFERASLLLDTDMLEREGLLPRLPRAEETLARLLGSEASLCRFGDGEFQILDNRPNLFQSPDPLLQRRLTEILASADATILIGLTQDLFAPGSDTPERARLYGRCFLAFHRHAILPTLTSPQPYANGSVTMPGFHFQPASMQEYFGHFRSLWQGRHVVLVQGRGLLATYAHNLFDTASELTIIDGPRRNAFESYEELMGQVRRYPQDALICLCLGTTATVMAFDLAREGYRALDLGHLPKAYDHWKSGKPFDDTVAFNRFFSET